MTKVKGNKKRVWRVIILVVLSLILIITTSTALFYHSKLKLIRYDNGVSAQQGSIDENDADVLAEQQRMAEAVAPLEPRESVAATGDIFKNEDYLNILLLGTDERTPYFNDNARGDTCMLLTLGKKDGAVKLVSFERGMGVPILEGQYQGQYDWLTHAFRYGGADLMMKEVQECFKVDVNHYFRVNLNTFEQGIETIGGIDINLTPAEAEYVNFYTQRECYVAGQNHLDGRAAITYARCRKIDSDWRRIERQRNVIQAALSKTKHLSVAEMNELLNDILPLIQTNLTEWEITNLLIYVPQYQGAVIEQMTIPVRGSYGSMTGMGGRSLFSVDFETNAKILRDFIYD